MVITSNRVNSAGNISLILASDHLIKFWVYTGEYMTWKLLTILTSSESLMTFYASISVIGMFSTESGPWCSQQPQSTCTVGIEQNKLSCRVRRLLFNLLVQREWRKNGWIKIAWIVYHLDCCKICFNRSWFYKHTTDSVNIKDLLYH